MFLAGADEQQIAQLGNAWVVQMGSAILGEIRNAIRNEWVRAGQPSDLQAWWNDRYNACGQGN